MARLVSVDTAVALVALAVGCGDDRRATPAAAAAQTPCTDADPEQERWGADCVCCHRGQFGAAGSVDRAAPPAAIVITDEQGEYVRLVPNAQGNFFTHVPLTPPLRVRVVGADGRSREMASAAPYGGCNECHAANRSVPLLRAPP